MSVSDSISRAPNSTGQRRTGAAGCPRVLVRQPGAGNLFMVFGEPDIDVREADGRLTVEIRGRVSRTPSDQ